MKMIVAIIQPDRLEAVREALTDSEITRLTVSRCTGHGRQQDTELYRGAVVTPDLYSKVRLEIAINDAFVQPTIDAILLGATHGDGRTGDGKIFVMPLEDVIRISTRETGGDAI
ncbi:MAG: nitrogen regulatory protein P-II 1 [Myxococcota bacterium]|jgi:nitrogen regulatory protein P-II 1